MAEPTYALEGAVVSVGGGLQWLHDDVALLEEWDQLDRMAAASDPALTLYMVPGFIGGGSDWLEDEARGAIVGLGRRHSPADLVRAALEAVGYQSHELFEHHAAGLGQCRRHHHPRRWRRYVVGLEHAVSCRHHRHAGGAHHFF